MQRNLATKIRAKWESGLTAVHLKWDPPVVNERKKEEEKEVDKDKYP